MTILSAAAAYGVAQQLEPSFTASTSVLLGGDAFSSDPEEAAQLALLDNKRISTAIEVLQSSRLLGKVADELDELGIDLVGPIEPESLGASPVEHAMRVLGFGDGTIDPDAAESTEEPSPEEQRRRYAIETLLENLSVSQIVDSSVIALSYTSHRPEIPALVVNLLVDQYIEELVSSRDRSRNRQIAWLNQNLGDLRAEIRTTQRLVEKRRAELSAEAGQGGDIIQRLLMSRADQLSAIQGEVARLSVLRDRLTFALGSGEPIQAFPEFSNSPTVQEIADELRSLENQIETLPEGSSARAVLEGSIQSRREDMREEARRIADRVSQDLVTARENERSLAAQVRELEDRLLRMNSRQLELRDLELEAEILRKNYETLSGQLFNTLRRTELRPIPVQVLSRAVMPEELESSGAVAAVLVGISGFLFAAGWVVLRDIFSNSFRSTFELEAVSGTRVVGRIPRARRHRPRQILEEYLKDSRSPLADAIRRLCINLGHLGPQKRSSVVLLAGSLGSEGAATIALLSAIQFQRLGRPTLLLDCSATGETVNAALRRDAPENGIQSVLTNASTLDAAIVQDPGTRLSILSWHQSGGAPLTTCDAFQTGEFARLLEELKERYANILFCVEPVLAAPDAKSVANLVDSVLLVVGWNRTPQMALLESIDELASVGRRPAGMVLNAVNEKKARVMTPWRARSYRARPRSSS